MTISCLQKHGDTPDWDWMSTPLMTGTWASLQNHTADIFSLTQASKLPLQVNHREASLVSQNEKSCLKSISFSKRYKQPNILVPESPSHHGHRGTEPRVPGQNPPWENYKNMEKQEQNQRNKAKTTHINLLPKSRTTRPPLD